MQYWNRNFGLIKVVFCLIAILTLLSSTASGFYFKSEDEIYLSGDFDEDVFLLGGNVNFDGSVVGDLFMAARTTTSNGDIMGNLHTVGQIATVNGSIERSYRAVVQTLVLNADIGGDATLFAQEITLSNDARVGRDAALFGATTVINGSIGSDAHIFSGKVNITGRIEGNLKIEAQKIIIAPSAYIGGNLEYTSGEKAEISSEAQIMGETKWKKETSASGEGSFLDWTPPPGGFVWSLVFLAGSILVGIVMVLSKRAGVSRVVEEIQDNGLVSGALGFALVFVVPVLVVMVGVTVIGLPLALIAFATYGALFWIAKVFAGIAIGVWIIGAMKKEGRPSLGWALLLGMLILALLFKIPYLGWVFYLIAWSLGLGAVTIVFFRRCRNNGRSAQATAGDGTASAAT